MATDSDALGNALTECFENYHTSLKRLCRYRRDSAYRIEKARRRATEQLAAIADLPALRDKHKGEKSLPPGDGAAILAGEMMEEMLKATESQPQMLYETVYVYVFALFDAFLLDALTAVLTHRPRLRTKIPPDRDARNLCRGKLTERDKDYQTRFGLDIIKGVDVDGITSLQDVDALRQKRNCLVHGGGKADGELVALAGGNGIAVGSPVTIGYAECDKAVLVTARIVDTVFTQLGQKYCPVMPHRPGWCRIENSRHLVPGREP